MTITLPTIIRFDAIADTVAFLILYTGRHVLSPLSGLSPEWLARLGVIPLCYALYAGWLIVFRAYRPFTVGALITANAAYSLFSAALLIAKHRELTTLGSIHLLFDSVFVGVLAIVEYRIARRTFTPDPPIAP